MMVSGRSLEAGTALLTGEALNKFIKEDIERTRKIAADEGWLVSN